MAVELKFAPEVQADVATAFDWYELRRKGLGDEFLSCLEACIQAICRMPEMHAIVYRDFRRALVRRFPYAVFCRADESAVTVISVFHTAREPGKWQERLR